MSEETLFHAALAKAPADRAAFLGVACAGQPELRAAVEALLAAHAASVRLLDQPVVDPNVTGAYTPLPEGTGVHVPHDAQPGYVIAGRYTLEQKLGEGGMGEVWVAQQTEPVKRKVALKLIKAGMDSKAVLQRFEAERQALALMDHPHIAKVLDAGVVGQVSNLSPRGRQVGNLSHSGHPFFVMELVNGLPLNKFCDEAKLTPKERLELFVPICQAVQHAHQKGIIHRDLKPANILVTLIDGKPVPKVIDFGVAKATAGSLTDEALETQFGAVVGTLEYMAPEQAGYSGEDIDTRADIYSLGVILYEMLTGLRPIDSKRLKKAALSEMIRIIREEEPSKPSTRLSTDEALPSLAAVRQTEPKKLMALLRGELDWVVMKCLEKQRDRRYETANGLAREIQRYLADEPVEARPPSFRYRAGKFLRRHKGPAIAAGVTGLALVGGITGTTWGLFRAESAWAAESVRAEGERKAKQEALVAAAAEKKAKEVALAREAETRAVLDFVEKKVFAAARPERQEGGLGREVTLRKAVESALPFVEKNFSDQPLIEARLRSTMGLSFFYLGSPDIAITQFERAHALNLKHRGLDHPATLDSLQNLANIYGVVGRYADAVPLLEVALPLYQARLPVGHRDTLACMHNLALSYEHLGRRTDALKLYEGTLALRKARLGPDHVETLQSMNNLANMYSDLGRHVNACTLREEVLKRRKAIFGPEHPDTLRSMSNLANSYYFLSRHTEALTLREETLALQKVKLGPNHSDTLRTMNNLSNSFYVLGRAGEALQLREETLARRTASLGRDHPETLGSINNLAYSYLDLGRPADALKLFAELVELWKAKVGTDHPRTQESRINLGDAYLKTGRVVEAIAILEEVRAQQSRTNPTPLDRSRTLNLLACAYREAGRLAEAVAMFRECLTLREQHEPNAWTTPWSKSLLGEALLSQKKYADAEPLLLAGYAGLKQRAEMIPVANKDSLTEALERLVQLYEATDKKDKAAKGRKELETLQGAPTKPETKP